MSSWQALFLAEKTKHLPLQHHSFFLLSTHPPHLCSFLWIYLLMATVLVIPSVSGITPPVQVGCCHSLLCPPLLTLSGRYPEPSAGRGGTTHHLVLFILLCGVLMSFPMISLDITSAQHAGQQQCWMASLQAHTKTKMTYFKCYYSPKHKWSQVITHELHYSFKFDALRGSGKLFFPLTVRLAKLANLRGYEVLACSHLYCWILTQILTSNKLKSFIDWPPWNLLLLLEALKKHVNSDF